MRRVWRIRIDTTIGDIDDELDRNIHGLTGGLGFISIKDSLKELVGHAVGYHQPEDYHDTILYHQLQSLKIPSWIAIDWVDGVIEKLNKHLRASTRQRLHYSTHTCIVSDDLRELVIAEDCPTEVVHDSSVHHTGHPVTKEIEWAKIYNVD